MTLHVKDAGSWKSVTPYVKDGGTWKAVTNAYVKDGGTWKEFFTAAAVPPTFYISAQNMSSGSNVVTVTLTLNSTGGVSWNWTAASVGSNPAGFYDSSSLGSVTDGFGSVVLTSNSKTASPGTRVLLNYNVSIVLGNGTADPLYLQVTHQF